MLGIKLVILVLLWSTDLQFLSKQLFIRIDTLSPRSTVKKLGRIYIMGILGVHAVYPIDSCPMCIYYSLLHKPLQRTTNLLDAELQPKQMTSQRRYFEDLFDRSPRFIRRFDPIT